MVHKLLRFYRCSYRSSLKLDIEFAIRDQLATRHQLDPSRFAPSFTNQVIESTIPYSEILHFYKGWIAKVKKSNQQFLEAL